MVRDRSARCNQGLLHVCPLCPLHCDDLAIAPDGSLSAGGCPIVAGFPDALNLPADRGDWNALPADCKRPLRVVTTGVDLITARELSRWQQEGQIELVIESDPSVQAVLDVVSRDGSVSATLADVATHADQVWLMGRVEETWPRIIEKLRLVSYSDTDESFPPRSIERFPQYSAEQLAELAAEIPARWEHSRYTAVLIGPAAFAAGEEGISAAMINRWVRLGNAQSRCVLVTLDSAATLRSVCLWQTNTMPSGSSLGQGQTAFDVRIGAPLSRDSRPARIQIGGADWGVEYALAYRASSIAGLHRASMTIRGDGSVSLPLAAPIQADLPTPGEIISALLKSRV